MRTTSVNILWKPFLPQIGTIYGFASDKFISLEGAEVAPRERLIKTKEWYEIGFTEGAEAGTSKLVSRRRDFGHHEEMLAFDVGIGHGSVGAIR